MLVFLWFAAVFSAFYPPMAPLMRAAAEAAPMVREAPGPSLGR